MAYDVTDSFKGAIHSSGKRKTVADLLYNRQVVARNIPLSSGSVTSDRSQAIRRSCSVVIADPTLIPDVATDTLDPYGVQIEIRSGVVYSDGDEELVNLGRFYIETAEWEEALYNRYPSITGYDKMYYFKISPFWTPWDFSGQTTQDAIKQLTWAVFDWWTGPGVETVTFDPSLINPKLPGGSIGDSGDSTIDFVTQKSNSIGGEMYVDYLDQFQVVPVPTVIGKQASDADWTIASGDGGSLVSAKRAVTRDGVYNVVIVHGPTKAGGQDQLTASAWDSDPKSKTYIYGPFGHSSNVIKIDTVMSQDQLNSYAYQRLQEHIALARSAQITCLANPAIQPGDIINVIYPDATSEVHLVNAIQYSFPGSTMTLTTKAKPTLV